MRAKKINKKLVLNKTTIAHLVDGEMNNVRGGWTGQPYATCDNTGCCISWNMNTRCYSGCFCD